MLLFGLLGVLTSFEVVSTMGFANPDSYIKMMMYLKQFLNPLFPSLLLTVAVLAAKRLKASNLLASRVDTIVLAGKLRVICFDKTGTLTVRACMRVCVCLCAYACACV